MMKIQNLKVRRVLKKRNQMKMIRRKIKEMILKKLREKEV